MALQGPLKAMPFTKNTPFCGIIRVGVPFVPHVSFHALSKAYIIKNTKINLKKTLNYKD